jgi:hypothetical protein
MSVTKEQIKEWKTKFGDVFKITVDGKVAYFRKPSRKTLGYAAVAGKENPLKFNEVIMRDCFLGGDEEIKTDDTLFLSASSKIGDIIETKEAELEKL